MLSFSSVKHYTMHTIEPTDHSVSQSSLQSKSIRLSDYIYD